MLCTRNAGSPQVVNTSSTSSSTSTEPNRHARGSTCTARSAATPTRGSSTRRATDDGTAHPPPSPVPRVRPPVHHGRDREPVGRQALRRHRAVQPRQGPRRRPQGLPGPPGHRGRPRPARPAGRGDHPRQGSAEIDAHEVGLAVLEPLRELDEVAYLRFASVYQAFDSLEDFEAAITLLRAERDATGGGAAGPDAGHAAEAATPAAPADRHPPRRPPRGHQQHQHHQCHQHRTAPQVTSLSDPSRTMNGHHGPRRWGRRKGQHDRDRRSTCRCSQVHPRQGGVRRAHLHDAGRAPLRRGDLGEARRRPAELEDRRDDLRAARRRVPRLLVASTPPRSSRPSTSAAPSAPRPARPGCAS